MYINYLNTHKIQLFLYKNMLAFSAQQQLVRRTQLFLYKNMLAFSAQQQLVRRTQLFL
jgi:hypothetical protein